MAVAPAGGGAAQLDAPKIDFGRLLWRRLWTIALLTLLGAAGGVTVLWNSTPIYESRADLYVRENAPRILGEVDLVGRQRNFLNTQARIITSSTVLGRAADNAVVKSVPTLARASNRTMALAETIGVTIGKDDDTLRISAQTDSPDDSQVIVQGVVDAYNDFIAETHRQTATDTGRDLREEQSRYYERREEIFTRRGELARQLGSMSAMPGEGAPVSIEAQNLAALNDSYLAANADLREVALTVASVEEAGDNAALLDAILPPLGDTSPARVAAAELEALQREKRDLEYTHGQNTARVSLLRRQIADIEQKLASLREQDLRDRMDLLQRRHELAKTRADQLKRDFDAQRDKVLDLSVNAEEWQKLERDLAMVDARLQQVSEVIENVNVTERMGPAPPEVLNDPQPGEKVAPVPAKIVGAGIVLGLLAGLGLAFLQEWLDPRLRTAEEIEDLLGLPIMGVVPSLPDKETPRDRARTMLQHPRSQSAEAYRDVRTVLLASLQSAAAAGEPGQEELDFDGRTILVTSPQSGDGKTTFSCNLAAAIARLNRRTLIIDADCRRPRLHDYLLDESTEVGLTNVLDGTADIADAIQATPVANLSLLPCGPLPADPAEMLDSEGFYNLLESLADEYDKIVIDSPPVLPVTDARVLGAITDATVLVLRANRSTRRGARHAATALLKTGANLCGIVVNDAASSRRRFGGSGGYGNYGGYGYGYGYAPLPTAEVAPSAGSNGSNGSAPHALPGPSSR